MKYHPVIGLETHIQSKTESKMFCSCPTNYFGKEPNTQTCPTCLGLPGALPVANARAIDLCLKLAIALNCKINRNTKFDRKNYFYPDLPKGYQISQFDLPIGYDGFIEIDVEKDARRIRLMRVHQEEDTGKSIHEDGAMLLDFNKSGVALIEVVSAPDLTSVKEVTEYAKELKRIVRYLNVSNADMEKGQMRFELNISLKEAGSHGLPPYKVEVKNIGSISVLEKVINFEIKRQSEILKKGKVPVQETRGLSGMSGETVSQRFKEGSADYRYFPEPDLPPIEINERWMQEISKTIPELPRTKRERYMKMYLLENDTARVITESRIQAAWFEQAVATQSPEAAKEIGKWFVGDFMSLKKQMKKKYSELSFKPTFLAELVDLVKSSKVSGTIAKQILAESFKTGKSPMEVMQAKGLEQISSEDSLKQIATEVIKENPKPSEQFKAGKDAVVQFLVGQVMRKTKGRANPKLAEKLLRELLIG